MAAGAICILALAAADIAYVNIIQAFFKCNLAGYVKCVQRCRRQMLHLVLREKTREMQRYIAAEICTDPPSQASDIIWLVIERRNKKIYHLNVHTHSNSIYKALLNRPNSSRTKLSVKIITHTFEVNTGSIGNFEQALPWFGITISGRNQHITHTGLLGQPGGIISIFVISNRVGICICD